VFITPMKEIFIFCWERYFVDFWNKIEVGYKVDFRIFLA
jgi:hypothetical protein